MGETKVFDKHLLRCNNPRCGAYVATLKILVDPTTLYAPKIKANAIDIAVVENVKCSRCGMKTDIEISIGISNSVPAVELPTELDLGKAEG